MVMVIAGFFCLMLPQYGYVLAKNYDFYFPTYISLIKQHVQPNTIHAGHFAHWFAFNDNRENYFYVTGEVGKSFSDKRFIWIRDSVWEPINVTITRKSKRLTQECHKELLSSFMYAGHTVRFEQYDCRKIKPSYPPEP